MFYFSTKATKPYWEIDFQKGDTLVFGKETKGLGNEILRQKKEDLLLIPILGPVRGYNVATAVALVAFEGLRQLSKKGQLDLSK